MKMKKQRYWMPAVILLLGVCAGILRGAEMAYHFDWETAMFESFSTAFVLPLCAAMTVLLTALFSVSQQGKTPAYGDLWQIRGKGGVCAGAVSALGLAVVGLITLRLYTSVLIWRPSYIVFGILTVLTGAVLLMLTLSRYRRQLSEYARFFSSLAVIWSCYLLVLTYMEHPVEPVLRVFCYDIFAVCFITLAIFCEVSTIFRQKKYGWVLFCTLNAVFFIFLTLIGRLTAFWFSGNPEYLADALIRMCIFLCIGIRLIQNAVALLSAKPLQK